jgi:hypothetical protein
LKRCPRRTLNIVTSDYCLDFLIGDFTQMAAHWKREKPDVLRMTGNKFQVDAET